MPVVRTINNPLWLQVDKTGNVALRGAVLAKDTTEFVVVQPGTNGQVLTCRGAGALPVWSDITDEIPSIIVTSDISATLAWMTLGSDPDNDPLHVQLSYTTDPAFLAQVTTKDTSTLQTNWWVFNQTTGVYDAFPAAGAGAAYYGKPVIFKLTGLTVGYHYFGRFRMFDGYEYSLWNGVSIGAQGSSV